MRIVFNNTLKLVLLSVLFGGMTACSKTSPSPRLYLLEPLVKSSTSTAKTQSTIVIGPVTLADHLNRKEILSRKQQFRVSISDFDHWAEPLDQNIESVMLENITRLIHAEKVFSYQWGIADRQDFTVRIQILSFGPGSADSIALNVIWEITDRAERVVALNKAKYSELVAGDDMSAMVAAMSQTLGQLSGDIAKALNRLLTSSEL